MNGFPKRIKFTSVEASDARYFQHSYSELSQREKAHSPKPNNLFAFQTYTVADSKKNRSQFLRFGGGLWSQFLRFRGGLRSQILRFIGGLRSQFLRFRGGLRSQFLRFRGGLRSQFSRFRGGLRSQFLRFRGDLKSQVLGVSF